MIGLAGTAVAARPATAGSAPVPCAARPTAAGYVKAENRRPGSAGWNYSTRVDTGLQAFANTASASCGQLVRLMVSTRAPRARMTAWRMGYYGGAGGRAVFTTGLFRTKLQPAAVVDQTTRTPRAPWDTTLMFRLDGRFIPGSYLLKITDSKGGQTFVPLTVTDPASTSPLVLMSEPLTWTAYNAWGGYSAYGGPRSRNERSLIVSFDRPYSYNHGMATYLTDEYPLVRLVEQRGLDTAYVTDTDLHTNPALLQAHKGVLVGGHAEYWSQPIRAGFEQARDAGVNIALFGANTAYWQVRMRPTRFGPNREFAIYREPQLDPVTASDPQGSTVRFRDLPSAQPEGKLFGQQYMGCPGRFGDMVVSNPDWPFPAGTPAGTSLPMGVQQEFDVAVRDAMPDNTPVQILADSPISGCGAPMSANVSYYTAPSGAGVFAAGTLGWVCHLYGTTCAYSGVTYPKTRAMFVATTINLVEAMAQQPLGASHPSKASDPPAVSEPDDDPGILSGDADADADNDASDDDDDDDAAQSWLSAEVPVGDLWAGAHR
ncbi:N,N-dimethylformamidase beta subunit family domain-containing protein [Krasilnikovia sp. MM14-A1259]|uniref:N,N-dimethylformamidase beta subunit family domain-containing protein n=1 Tax=Krasilnikovia sp. MM14-A1259 TaxID=3373539 RepID=UPI00399CA692